MSTNLSETKLFELVVRGIVQETSEARSFIFDVPEDLRATFTYQPGQFLTFKIPFEGMLLKRSYSLSSSPGIDAHLKVTVKKIPQGRISQTMNSTLNVGDKVLCEMPAGLFIRNPLFEGNISCYAGGSGITPMMSIIKDVLNASNKNIFLFYANKDKSSIIFYEDFVLLTKRFPQRLSVHHHLDSEQGFANEAGLSDVVAARPQDHHFICGPGPFMDAVRAALAICEVPRSHITIEKFLSYEDPDRVVQSAPIENSDGAPEYITMRQDKQEHKIPYTEKSTLLDAMIQSGFKPPFSCKEGACATCMVKMLKGKVNMDKSDALCKEDVNNGWILACQARACSKEPIVIDYDFDY